MSILAMVAVAAMVGVGSYAVWVSNQVTSDGYAQAGYMGLTVDEGQGFEVSNVAPGTEGVTEVTFTNTSTVPATLAVKLESLKNYENYCVQAEQDQGGDNSCALQTDMIALSSLLANHEFTGGEGDNEYGHSIGHGELAENIIIDSIEINGEASTAGAGMTLYDFYALSVAGGSVITSDRELTAGEAMNVKIHWHVNSTEVTDPFADSIPDNQFMTDAVEGVFKAVLVQEVPEAEEE